VVKGGTGGVQHTSTLTQNLLNEPIPLHILAIPAPSAPPRPAVLPQPHLRRPLLPPRPLLTRLQPPLRGLRPRDVAQRRVRAEVDLVQLAQRGGLALREAVLGQAGWGRALVVAAWVTAGIRVRAGVAVPVAAFGQFGVYVGHPCAR